MLSLKIPFYEPGRIAKIEEKDKCFIVDRYGIDDKIDKSFVISNKGNNFNELLENYYSDLEGYLNYYRNKYDNSLGNVFDKIGYMKYFKNIKYLFAFLAVMPVMGVLIESTILTIMGLILELVFVPSFVILDKYSRFYDAEKEKSAFIKEYGDYFKLLDVYNKGRSKKSVSPTKYKGVNKPIDRTKERVGSMKKEKSL